MQLDSIRYDGGLDTQNKVKFKSLSEVRFPTILCVNTEDYFIYSQLAAPSGNGAVPVAKHRVGDDMTITEETAREWASAIGGVTVGEMDILGVEGHSEGNASELNVHEFLILKIYNLRFFNWCQNI